MIATVRRCDQCRKEIGDDTTLLMLRVDVVGQSNSSGDLWHLRPAPDHVGAEVCSPGCATEHAKKFIDAAWNDAHTRPAVISVASR